MKNNGKGVGNLTCCCGNKKFMFSTTKYLYFQELTISETTCTESTKVASYLDLLLFTRDENNNITTKLYDKRDTFGFHIMNFPFMSSHIPSAPAAYNVIYASRYARCCSNYSDFLSRHRVLVTRLVTGLQN